MGWACGIVNGREVGYAVEATCDHPGCTKKIDRGLAYVCGNDHGGGEHGCGNYFCEEHRDYVGVQLCITCADSLRKQNPELENE